MSRRCEELNPAAGFNAMAIRKPLRGEEAIYRGFRIYALTRFAASFSSTKALHGGGIADGVEGLTGLPRAHTMARASRAG